MFTQEMELVCTDATEVDGTRGVISDAGGDTTEQSLDNVEAWIRDNLPDLNTAVETDDLNAVGFMEVIRPKIDALRLLFGEGVEGISKAVAQRLLKLLGFLIGSAECHFQAAGQPKGTTWSFVPEAEDFMADVANIVGLPPILSLHGYWLADRGNNALTFTGEDGERLFKSCTQIWATCTKEAGDRIRPVCNGEVAIDTRDAVAAIKTAARCYLVVDNKYRQLQPHSPGSRSGLKMKTFQRFRVYLCSFPVHGKISTGPNVANLRPNFSADVLTGISDESYVPRITERLEYLTPEDQQIVLNDLSLPSLIDRFLEHLGLTKAEMLVAQTSQVAQRIAAHSAIFHEALENYNDLNAATVKLSNKHWGSILSLKTYSESLTSEQRNGPVSTETSVSGAGHARPEAIHMMRRANSVVNKLLASWVLFRELSGRTLKSSSR